jgi:hypothetical protein
LNVKFGVANVIKFRLLANEDALAWSERKSPLGE